MQAKKLTNVRNSIGLVLPKEWLSRFNLAKGDAVYLVDTPNGFTITPYNPGFEQQVNAARKIIEQRRDVLKGLAE